MSSSQTQKEALFNEVKGSLFEFLVGQNLARAHQSEKDFLESIDKNYLNVLTQQDRMVRQFYPEMGTFLRHMAENSVKKISAFLGEIPSDPRLTGKLVNSTARAERDETDLLVNVKNIPRPLSLKLNKKGAFVNTKSGGVKSFFSQYFPFIDSSHQAHFNQIVDLEFERMSRDLHDLVDLEWTGSYASWVARGYSELPGELPAEQREILKAYYARLADAMHVILTGAFESNQSEFRKSLLPLMGFSSPDIIQVVCFHDFKRDLTESDVHLHDLSEVDHEMKYVSMTPSTGTASVEVNLGLWTLQIRIKPMNKFTTTAIKMNCSVKVKQSSEA